MTDKSPWSFVGGWGRTAAKPLRTSTRRCDAGHPMDPNWAYCPYCKAAGGAGERTQFGTEPVPPTRSRDDGAPAFGDRNRTRINSDSGVEPSFEEDAGTSTGAWQEPEAPAPEPARAAAGRTRVLPAGGEPVHSASNGGGGGGAGGAGGGGGRGRTAVLDVNDFGKSQGQRRPDHGRRLTGIVVTYTWSPLGHLYEVHEGRNFAGSGQVAAEGHRDSDILVDDPALSSSHFLILCQGGQYRISDCNSTNGTFVNDQQIDPLGIELVNDAVIKAGDTVLVFKKLGPPPAKPQAQERPGHAHAPAPAPAPTTYVRREPSREDDPDELS